MKISAEDCLREFQKTLPNEYSKLSLTALRDICFSPWRFLRKEIQSGYLNEIRFTYFGVFRVSVKKALFELSKAKFRHDKGYITDEEFYRIKSMVENFQKSQDNDIDQ